jgi:hypothetical protein
VTDFYQQKKLWSMPFEVTVVSVAAASITLLMFLIILSSSISGIQLTGLGKNVKIYEVCLPPCTPYTLLGLH